MYAQLFITVSCHSLKYSRPNLLSHHYNMSDLKPLFLEQNLINGYDCQGQDTYLDTQIGQIEFFLKSFLKSPIYF